MITPAFSPRFAGWLPGALLLTIGLVATSRPANAASGAPPIVELFDGKTLNGWKQVDGKAKIEVRDGTIVGLVTPGAGNTYLATEDDSYGDFVFECEFRCAPGVNSGIQFRSRFAHDAIPRAYGYQYEIDPTPRGLTGALREAGRRSWLVPTSDEGEPQQAWVRLHGNELLPGWNQAKIEARGRRIRTWLNGRLLVDYQDTADIAIPRGFIGIQVHGTNNKTLWGKEVAFRNLRVQRLAP